MADDWITNPQAWNKVRLGSLTLPGVAKVTMDRGRDIDFKKAPGKDGGTSTDKGANEGKIRIRLQMNAKQWREEWPSVIAQIEPAQGKPSGPFGIVHPEPNSRGIDTIEIKNIASEPPTARGGIVYTLNCQQWFPRPKDTKKKSPSTSGLVNGTGNKLFTKAPGEKFGESLVLPSGIEALELALGPQEREGTTVVSDPVTGEMRDEQGSFYD